MERLCPCGQPVYPNRGICRECGRIYGFRRSEWPEWLRMLVNENNREFMEESRRDELSLEREIEPNGRGGYRAKREFALRGCRTETHVHGG